MAPVNNFDVLRRLAQENKSIQLCSTITQMNYSAKKGGTEVSVGVPGNVCFEIESGRMNALLLLFDMRQFNEMKKAMEQEAAERCPRCGIGVDDDEDGDCAVCALLPDRLAAKLKEGH